MSILSNFCRPFLKYASAWLAISFSLAGVGSAVELAIEQGQGSVQVKAGQLVIADYVFRDDTIVRPYFANLHSPTGVRLTRNHPPIAGQDRMDHAEYHPGLWLAFGDLSGSDNWRLKAPVEYVRFLQEPQVVDGVASFAVENRYRNASDDATLCVDRSRYTLRPTDFGILITWDSTFQSDKGVWFGDQEEMGLGIRLATPLRVEQQGPDPAPPGTGEIIDNKGRRNAAEIWGKAPRWIDYRGRINDEAAGVALFCHPNNFRPSRMHARDYGFVTANPFAIAAFDAGPASRVQVAPGETLRLRFGVLLHSGSVLTQSQLENAFAEYRRAASP